MNYADLDSHWLELLQRSLLGERDICDGSFALRRAACRFLDIR
jgi:hypothetical protein